MKAEPLHGLAYHNLCFLGDGSVGGGVNLFTEELAEVQRSLDVDAPSEHAIVLPGDVTKGKQG